jgi:hypothetical protein
MMKNMRIQGRANMFQIERKKNNNYSANSESRGKKSKYSANSESRGGKKQIFRQFRIERGKKENIPPIPNREGKKANIPPIPNRERKKKQIFRQFRIETWRGKTEKNTIPLRRGGAQFEDRCTNLLIFGAGTEAVGAVASCRSRLTRTPTWSWG